MTIQDKVNKRKCMKLRYIYSACVLIETDTTKVLCDPWFTQGIYYGSWFQYPRLPKTLLK